MLTKLFCKKLSQATAITAIASVVVMASGTQKAEAANLKTFKVSGTFGDEKSLIGGTYNQNEAFAPKLVNGSFSGTYTVNAEQLPSKDSVGFENWDVKLRNSLGTVIGNFYSPEPFFPPNFGSVQPDNISFVSDYYTFLNLFVNSKFIGTSTGRPQDVGLGIPVYGFYKEYANRYELGSGIYVTSFKSELVPEPLTLGGTAVAGVIGLWLRRKHKTTC